jgi:hypothetical protein
MIGCKLLAALELQAPFIGALQELVSAGTDFSPILSR